MKIVDLVNSSSQDSSPLGNMVKEIGVLLQIFNNFKVIHVGEEGNVEVRMQVGHAKHVVHEMPNSIM